MVTLHQHSFGSKLAAGCKTIEATVAVKLKAELGEGSIWDARSKRLLWLDIMNAKLYRFDPETEVNEEHDLSMHSTTVSSVVPVASDVDPSGNTVCVTLREGFALYNFNDKTLEVLLGNPPVAANERFNDGKVDPAGRFWAGTITRNEANEPIPGASLYRRNLDGSVDKVLSPVTISNGVCWTEDGSTMYYIDTPTAKVDAFDYDVSTGEAKNPHACITGFDFNTTGYPDGCAIDNEGMLWVARFNGGCAGRYNPLTGELLAEVRVPAEAGHQVTSVAFGGEDLGDLYITTAREGKTAEEAAAAGQPLAGCLFRALRKDLSEIKAAVGLPVNMLRLAR